MLLQSPDLTRLLIVTLPETTPVLEAGALQDDLRRAQIEPFAWVINGSLAAAQTRDPVLRARAIAEIAQIRKVKEQLAKRVALIPFQAEEPVGIERLTALSSRAVRAPRVVNVGAGRDGLAAYLPTRAIGIKWASHTPWGTFGWVVYGRCEVPIVIGSSSRTAVAGATEQQDAECCGRSRDLFGEKDNGRPAIVDPRQDAAILRSRS
jgi:hypothetical protein